MATINTTRNYNDGEVLVRADLDAFLDDIEAFLNVTKVNDDNIQNSGITGSTKLLNSSVTNSKLAADSVTTLKIVDENVTAAKLAADSVTTVKILDANVTAAKLASDSVITAKILDANVTAAKLANDSVTTVKILDSNVTAAKINDSAVTTAKINAAAVTPAKLSTNYIDTTANGAFTISGAGTLATLSGSLTTYGRPLRITVYSGSLTISSSTGGSNPVFLRANSTNLIQLFDFGTGSTGTRTFGTPTVNASTVAGWYNDVNVYYVPTLAAGTYSFDIRMSAGNNFAGSFSSVKFLIEEI